jgi:predicted RNA-binding protein YlxR (DUF448 family)
MAVRTPTVPVRTCIGCRQRAAAAELLRVVVATDATGAVPEGAALVVPDPRHRAPGRGAWLHRDPDCVDLAQRRRAFARAFRTPGPVDPTPVREYVWQPPGTPASGTPQELTIDGLAMKPQQ